MTAPLTDAELQDLRARLEQRLATLEAAVAEAARQNSEQRIGHYAGEVHDRGEESAVDSAAEVHSAVYDNHEAELRLVRGALQRMSEEDYGLCVNCGADIGYQRLTATPHAARCLRCQEQLERQGRG